MKDLVQNGEIGLFFNIDQKSKNDSTPLHSAADQGHLEIVKYLIEKGAKIDPKNKDGHTPHFLAAKNDHYFVVDYLTKAKKRKAENEPGQNSNRNSKEDPCLICKKPKNGLFALMPCGHSCLCEPCCIELTTTSKNYTKCPTCRKPADSYQYIPQIIFLNVKR